MPFESFLPEVFRTSFRRLLKTSDRRDSRTLGRRHSRTFYKKKLQGLLIEELQELSQKIIVKSSQKTYQRRYLRDLHRRPINLFLLKSSMCLINGIKALLLSIGSLQLLPSFSPLRACRQTTEDKLVRKDLLAMVIFSIFSKHP